MIGDDARVNALLDAALPLCEPADTATLVEVHTARHAALYSLGRLEETDTEYGTSRSCARPRWIVRTQPTVQVRSLTHRTRYAEAVGLAIGRCVSWASPSRPRTCSLRRPSDSSATWTDGWTTTDDADELARPELTDPALLAATHLLNAATPAAYLAADHAALTWLSLEALRIWTNQGAAPALLYPVSYIAFATELRGDRARRVPGAAADPGGRRGPAATSPAPLRSASCSPLSAGPSDRSTTPSRRLSGPGRGCSLPATWPTPDTPAPSPCVTSWTARPR